MPTNRNYLHARVVAAADDLLLRIESLEAALNSEVAKSHQLETDRDYWIDRCKNYEKKIRDLNKGLLAQGRELAQCRECLSEDVADEYPKVLGVAHIPTLPPCAYVALEIAPGKSHHLYVPPSVYDETVAWATELTPVMEPKSARRLLEERMTIDEGLGVWALNNYDATPGTPSGPSTESEWVEGHRVLPDE